MSENILDLITNLTQNKLTKSEDSMDFTLSSYHKEKIAHHIKMLNYYLKEQKNEELGN